MLKRVLAVITLSCSLAFAADPPAGSPPKEASVKQLLEAMQARSLVDSVMAQMEQVMKNTLQQASQAGPVSPEVQKIFDNSRAEVVTIFKEQFTWDKLEPVYMRIYQKSFTEAEVEGMVAFYKTPAGQALLNKMPAVMQSSMDETTQLIGPVTQRIQRMQFDMMTAIKAEKEKKGGS
jgi:hypothetical protein